jgi:hypothetical protein
MGSGCRWLAESAFIRRATPDGLKVTLTCRGRYRMERMSEIGGMTTAPCPASAALMSHIAG